MNIEKVINNTQNKIYIISNVIVNKKSYNIEVVVCKSSKKIESLGVVDDVHVSLNDIEESLLEVIQNLIDEYEV